MSISSLNFLIDAYLNTYKVNIYRQCIFFAFSQKLYFWKQLHHINHFQDVGFFRNEYHSFFELH